MISTRSALIYTIYRLYVRGGQYNSVCATPQMSSVAKRLTLSGLANGILKIMMSGSSSLVVPHIQSLLNPLILRVPLEIIVCFSYAFENNLGRKQKVHKIFEEELLLFGFWLTFLLQKLSKKRFCWKNIFKFVRPVLAAVSGKVLTH